MLNTDYTMDQMEQSLKAMQKDIHAIWKILRDEAGVDEDEDDRIKQAIAHGYNRGWSDCAETYERSAEIKCECVRRRRHV